MGKRLFAVLVTALLALGLSACGGDGDDTQEASEVTTTTTTTEAPADDDEGDDVDVTDLLEGECEEIVDVAAAMGYAMAAAVDPAQAAELEKYRDAVDLDEIDSEIRDDVEVMLEFAEGMGEALADADVNLSGEPDPEAYAAIGEYMEGVDQERVEEASDNLQAWIEENCGG